MILLHELEDFVAEQNSHESRLRNTSGLAMRDGPLDQYKRSLEILVPKITGHGLCKIGQVLAWKFSKEEVGALLSQIERIKSRVQSALEMDHMFVAQLDYTLSPSRADYLNHPNFDLSPALSLSYKSFLAEDLILIE